MRRWIKEPLVQFFMIGALFFALDGKFSGNDNLLIDVDQQRIDWLKTVWQRQWRREPTAAELQILIDQHIREEVFYREAMALGLDQNDVIVRRRMVQKLSFLLEDIALAEGPSNQLLQQFYLDYGEQFREPEKLSFSHIYFSESRREQSHKDAQQLLNKINTGHSKIEKTSMDIDALGDPFMLQNFYARRSPQEIAELFGSVFSETLSAIDTEQWFGPVRSAYGLHLVKISARDQTHIPALSDVREKVLVKWQEIQRQSANEDLYKRLKEKYRIRLTEPATNAQKFIVTKS